MILFLPPEWIGGNTEMSINEDDASFFGDVI